jgi:hypothetical protein
VIRIKSNTENMDFMADGCIPKQKFHAYGEDSSQVLSILICTKLDIHQA